MDKDHRAALATGLGMALLAAALVGALQADAIMSWAEDRLDADDEARAPEGFTYYSIAQVSGLAKGGLPILPLGNDSFGNLVGVPTAEGVTIPGDTAASVLPWFRYCGYEERPGLQPGYDGDDLLRYVDMGAATGHREQWGTPWYAERHGEPIRPGDIPPGRSVIAAWRSDPGDDNGLILVHVLRVDNATEANESAEADRLREWYKHDGLMAFSATSTHMCVTTHVAGDPHTGSASEARYIRRLADNVRGLNNSTPLVVDAHSGSVWNPAWVIRDSFYAGGLVTADG